ncbi:PilZ domain-containing protein [Desulfococcaceae bacterium HSG7]|nr:PilZ domain-containing protein [Desulfococcaceae bacterium HSG9]MDM8556280.1 PilZ domain-containing protein [Desulfococcaceae bacterium HSG7]
MSNNTISKRRHLRVYFKVADMLKLHVAHPILNETPFVVKVMNISESGLCFFLSKVSTIKIKKDDLLVFEKIEGAPIFKAIIKIDMAVRWCFHEEMLDHQICGCEFLNMPSNYKSQLRAFIKQKISSDSLNSQAGTPTFNS